MEILLSIALGRPHTEAQRSGSMSWSSSYGLRGTADAGLGSKENSGGRIGGEPYVRRIDGLQV